MSRVKKTEELFTGFASILPLGRRKTNREQPSPQSRIARSIRPEIFPHSFGHSQQGRITAKLGDRWAIFGSTGSGKTTFARKLLLEMRRHFPDANIYVIDSKFKAGDFDSFPGLYRGEEAPDLLRVPGSVMVWQPPYDDQGEYSLFFERILKKGEKAFVYIDELSSIGGKSGASFPLGFNKLLKQGRGLDIGLGVASQEAAYIPRNVLGQATHVLRFRMNNSRDRTVLDRDYLLRDKPSIAENPAGYGFIYRNLERAGKSLQYNDFREFFGSGGT